MLLKLEKKAKKKKKHCKQGLLFAEIFVCMFQVIIVQIQKFQKNVTPMLTNKCCYLF